MLFFRDEDEEIVVAKCEYCSFFEYADCFTGLGFCRRYPPANEPIGTSEKNFCGEFKAEGYEV